MTNPLIWMLPYRIYHIYDRDFELKKCVCWGHILLANWKRNKILLTAPWPLVPLAFECYPAKYSFTFRVRLRHRIYCRCHKNQIDIESHTCINCVRPVPSAFMLNNCIHTRIVLYPVVEMGWSAVISIDQSLFWNKKWTPILVMSRRWCTCSVIFRL